MGKEEPSHLQPWKGRAATASESLGKARLFLGAGVTYTARDVGCPAETVSLDTGFWGLLSFPEMPKGPVKLI